MNSCRSCSGVVVAALALVGLGALQGCTGGGQGAVWFNASPRSGPAPLQVTFHGYAVPPAGTFSKFRETPTNEPPSTPTQGQPQGPATGQPSSPSWPTYTPVYVRGYRWSFGDGAFSTSRTVTHSYAAPGTYTVTLRVSFSNGTSGTAESEITVTDSGQGNRPPIADAGNDRMVLPGTTVDLNGTGSNDADGDPLTYAWTLTSVPTSSTASLSDADAVNPSFVTDLEGEYVVSLVVNDGEDNSLPDVAVITAGQAANGAPTADAGPNRTVTAGSRVQLDGSRSRDPDGDGLTYAWSFVTGDASKAAQLSDPAAVAPTFVAEAPGPYVIQLVVNDGQLSSKPGVVTVEIGTTANTAPVADAGPDRNAATGATVPLDGAASIDADGDDLTYSWSFLTKPAGSAATFAKSSSATPTFSADMAGVFVVQLIVNDGAMDSEPDTVTVTAAETQSSQSPPNVAVSPLSYTLAEGRTLNIPVAGTDPDGDVVSLAAGPALDNATFAASGGTNATGTFSFTPGGGQQGMHTVSFTARDPQGLTDTKHVQITVTNVNRPPSLSVPDAVSVDEGQVAAIALDAEDPDSDALTLTAAPLPENALFVAAAGTITFAPDYDQAGVYDIVCEASDGVLSSGPQTVRVTVNDVTAPPGEPVGLDLLVNSPESPSLLAETRVTGSVNGALSPPPVNTISAALITGMTPATGAQGQTLDVTLTGQTAKNYPTHFADGVSTASFGQGITVNSTQVTGANTAVVNITIAGNAETGARSVSVNTGSETAVCTLAFTVTRGGATVTGTVVDPDTGLPIAGAIVSIEGTNLWTTTDENGRYTLYNVPTGRGVLIINPPDHQLVRLDIDPQPGETTDAGQTETQATVYDPTAPPAATTLSVVGRGVAGVTGEIGMEAAKRLVEDTMILCGGADAGILDEYGNQMNPALTGEGQWSLTSAARDALADRMTRAESYSLQEVLYSLSYGMEWTDGPPDLGEWLASLQAGVNEAWQDPAAPENALLVLVFNKGNTILLNPPELLPETRLNAMQTSLFASSIMTFASKSLKDPASYGLTTKRIEDRAQKATNSPPVAKAGPDRNSRTGMALQLDASMSYDREQTALTYGWELVYKPSGSTAALNDPSALKPTITPDEEGYYKVRLTVDDGDLRSIPDHVNIVVDNGVPIANAGLDRRVAVGETVYLSGAQSEDPGGLALTFDWAVYSAPPSSTAALFEPNTINPAFEPDYDGEYVISLTVSNGFDTSDPDYVVITAGNRKPVAYAGLNQIVQVGDEVFLDGTRSYDPDGDTLSYDWLGTAKPAGSSARLNNRQSATPSFVVDKAGTYVIRLIVRDASSESEEDSIQVTTDPPHYFDKYWHNFFSAKESKITNEWAGQAWVDEMALHQWTTMMPGAGNISGASMARPMAGESARDLAGSIIDNRASMNVPEPPRIKRAEVIVDEDGTRRVEVELDKKLIKKNTGTETCVYRLYRFQGNTNERKDIESASFDASDDTYILKDAEPLLGTHLYAVNLTRYTGTARNDEKETFSWWPAAFATSMTAFANGRDRLTSDYSEAVALYAGPGDFAVTIDGLEVDPDTAVSTVYYSDAEKGMFWAIDINTGEHAAFATAGFKQSGRDGRAIIQNGLAIDRDGNLYTDNAASDASFGGRLFRFTQPNGSREMCGVINYYSSLLGFAHPVFSGPMVIRPRVAPAKETLIVAENLSQELREVPVNESTWDAGRRVGQKFATIPSGGWGRVIDMEFDEAGQLYVLDGLRVLRFKSDGSHEVYVTLNAAK